ncbi:MAG: hypothetical protein OEZ39_17085 [Gammaproteobacteria bacterium]|nr:hypothetical protein [Gammaproteobacteria bacterium]MDH5653577.1 hypothetical protein [Gammaproteobacteria bacterium]
MGKIIQTEHSKDKPVDNSDIDFTEADGLTEEKLKREQKVTRIPYLLLRKS